MSPPASTPRLVRVLDLLLGGSAAFALVVSTACHSTGESGFRSDNLAEVTESLADAACTQAATCGSFVIHCSGGADSDDAGSEPECVVEEQNIDHDTCLQNAQEEFASSVGCFSSEIVAAAEACYDAMLAGPCETKEDVEAGLAAGNPQQALVPACQELMTLSAECTARSRDEGLFPANGPEIHAGPPSPQRMSSMPCGDRTLATLEVANGQFVFFCDLGDGAISIGEAGRLDQSSVFADQVFDCPLDVFETFAPAGVEPPAQLQDDCAFRMSYARVAGSALDLTASVPTKGSHYCSGAGAEEFQDERCGINYAPGYYATCAGGGYLCTSWCFATATSWHQKSSGGQFGQEADAGVDVIASCGAATRFRGWWDGNLIFDNTVLPNYWQWHGIGPDGNIYLLPDHEIKFRGDSFAGAYHRAAGGLQDWHWP